MIFDYLEPLLKGNSFEVLGIFSALFLVLTFVLLKGVSWVFARHRMSRVETEDRLKELRRSTFRRFLMAMALVLFLDLLLEKFMSKSFDDPRLGNAAFVGILLTAISDLFMASSIVLFVSIFTRPITEIFGGLLDFVQSLVLAILSGFLLRSLADFDYFKMVVAGIPIALVLGVASVVYSVAGTVLWIFGPKAE